jgi:acyl-CoA synthetase (NDP forming)
VFCRSETEIRVLPASEAARVLKIVSRALPHKTEAGAVRTGLVGVEALVSAYVECRDSAARYLAGDSLIEGALVSPHLPEPIAEMLVGVRRDPEYGPILTLGSGGVEVEVDPDASIRGLPITAEDIEDMCRELARGVLLFGYRGRPAADVGALGAAAMALGDCLLDHPDIAELELNPTFVYADRVVAVDASGRRIE